MYGALRKFDGLKIVNVPGDWKVKRDKEYVELSDLKMIFHAEEERDNEWYANETIKIYQGKNGFGLVHEIPGGYSTCTYDPDMTENYYEGLTWDQFYRLALTQDQRDLLGGFKPEGIE